MEDTPHVWIGNTCFTTRKQMTQEEINKLKDKIWNLDKENSILKLKVSQLKMEVESLHKFYNIGRLYTWEEYINNTNLSFEEVFKRLYK